MTNDMELELVRLRRSLLTMAASAEARVAEAIQALLQRDTSLAEHVRAGDDEIDQMEVDIESACLRILALYQPLATDLRFVLAAMRINTSLERMADLARSVAKRARKLAEATPVPMPPVLLDMAQATREMVADALKAVSTQDAELARQVRGHDAAVDAKNKEVLAWVVREIPSQVDNVQPILGILLAARTIERIADTAAAIAEDVMFAVGGAIVRHTPA